MATAAIAPRTALPFIHPDDMPDRYCLPGIGTCMEPLIANGSLVAFDKREKPRRGDIVCLIFTRASAQRYGVPGMIKRLAMDVPDGFDGFDTLVVVEQINPVRTLTFWTSELLAVHKFIGLPERRSDGGAWVRLPKREG